MPRIKGNELFTRSLEELERRLSPRRAGEALHMAVTQVGATPENVTLGHLGRAGDLSLPQALAPHCEPDEAQEICTDLARLLDELAGEYFRG